MIKIARAFGFAKAAFIAYKTPDSDIEKYDNFKLALQERRGGGLTEKYVIDTFDQWRRAIIKNELKVADFKEIAAPVLLEKDRQLSILAAISTAIAMLFPPFHLSQGGSTYHLGFFYIGDRQLGDVNSQLLLCELVAIWLVRRFLSKFIALPN